MGVIIKIVIMEKKIVVFDNQHYLFRFLKQEFTEFKIIKGKQEITFKEIFEEFSIVVFVIYSESDLIDLFRIYFNGVRIVICCPVVKILNRLFGIRNLALIDTSQLKFEMVRDLCNCFCQAVYT